MENILKENRFAGITSYISARFQALKLVCSWMIVLRTSQTDSTAETALWEYGTFLNPGKIEVNRVVLFSSDRVKSAGGDNVSITCSRPQSQPPSGGMCQAVWGQGRRSGARVKSDRDLHPAIQLSWSWAFTLYILKFKPNKDFGNYKDLGWLCDFGPRETWGIVVKNI